MAPFDRLQFSLLSKQLPPSHAATQHAFTASTLTHTHTHTHTNSQKQTEAKDPGAPPNMPTLFDQHAAVHQSVEDVRRGGNVVDSGGLFSVARKGRLASLTVLNTTIPSSSNTRRSNVAARPSASRAVQWKTGHHFRGFSTTTNESGSMRHECELQGVMTS